MVMDREVLEQKLLWYWRGKWVRWLHRGTVTFCVAEDHLAKGFD